MKRSLDSFDCEASIALLSSPDEVQDLVGTRKFVDVSY
jgi:hypothetical protein